MNRTADVVIIGGGIMGMSIAYHLSARGCSDVILLEKDQQFGTGATGTNAGGIRHQFSTKVNIELSKRSIKMIERFPEEMDQEVDINFCGYLFLLDNDRDVASFKENIVLQHTCGIETELLDPTQIARSAPQIQIEDIMCGAFYGRDGITDPHSVLQGYTTQARHLGAQLETGTSVSDMKVKGGRIQAVGLQDGTWIESPTVIIAGGPWSGDIAALAGVDLPVQPVMRQIMVTRPIEGVGTDFPFVIDFSKSLYFHYESGGVLTGMSNPDQSTGFDTRVDEEWRMTHFSHAVDRMPLLEFSEVLTEWGGLYEVTPDAQPILGKLPQVDGLYSCTGFSGHGFMHGPICGLLLAEEVLDGSAKTVDIDSLRWDRFESGLIAGEYNVV